jgi:hypothetical protein
MTISDRKKRLEDRLAKHGIKDYRVNYLPYLDFDDATFATPYEAGCRMMILYAVAYAVTETNERKKIVDWLTREDLWTRVAPSERELLEGRIQDEQKLIDFSWQGECAYILAWSLNLIHETPTPTRQINEQELDNFMNVVPAIGDEVGVFLASLRYRKTEEVSDENLFHELATTYFRDLMFNGKKDTSNIERSVSFLRHQALNWLRRFMDIEDWDKTDTST